MEQRKPRQTWRERTTDAVGDAVARYRKERGLSAQQLADRCAQLGGSLPRGVIAKLESRSRGSVTVDELLVLAEALGVPVVRLLAPLDNGDVELFPGVPFGPWEAAMRAAALGTPESELLRNYAVLVARMRSMLGDLENAKHSPHAPVELATRMVLDQVNRLIDLRQDAERLGMAPPRWPDDIASRLAKQGLAGSG